MQPIRSLKNVATRRKAAVPTSAASRVAPDGALRRKPGDEAGAILILALVYIVSVSLIVLALATWATNDLRNTTNFASISSIQNAASGATKVAIESVRVNPVPSDPSFSMTGQLAATSPAPCWGSGTVDSSLSFKSGKSTNPAINVAVWCSTTENLTSEQTRIVTFSACQLTPALAALSYSAGGLQCAANPLLQAVVAFDDYPPQGAVPFTQQCNISQDGLSCGQGMTLEDWSLNGQLSNTIIITSPAPTAAVVGGMTYTATAASPSNDGVTISAGTPSVCTVSPSGVSMAVVSFVGVGNCVIDFSDPGNSKYGAAQVTQNFSVGNGSQATLVVTSTTGSHTGTPLTTTGGSGTGAVTYTVANGSDSGCTVTGAVLTATTSGTCYVTATKAADANWQATSSSATTVTLS